LESPPLAFTFVLADWQVFSRCALARPQHFLEQATPTNMVEIIQKTQADGLFYQPDALCAPCWAAMEEGAVCPRSAPPSLR